MKIEQKFAIRYYNGFFHCWDNKGDFDFAKNIDEAHLVFKRDSANSIANVILNISGLECHVEEVTYIYQIIEDISNRSK